jgi:hypothetical protein
MPAGTVTDQHGMGRGADLGCDLGQVPGHRLAADKGHDDGRADRAGGADRAEQGGAVVAIVAHRGRTRTARRPKIGQRALLADTGLVLEPDLDRLADRRGRQHLGYAGGEVYGMARPSPLPQYAGRAIWGMGVGSMQIAVLGIDLGKNSCSVVGLDAGGRVVLRRRLQRDGAVKLAAGLPGCVMAIEACCGAHHLGRRLRDQGH